MKLTIITIFIVIIGLMGITYYHEQAHVEIFRQYGIPSHVEYFSHFPDVVTIPEKNSSACTDDCILANNINEAITYPLFAFAGMIGVLFFVVIGLLELNLKKESWLLSYN